MPILNNFYYFLFIFCHETVNRCPQLSAPAHGSVEPCSNLPGHTCQFSCDQGYVLSGATTRTCNNDGTWTGLQTQCNGEFPGLFRDSKFAITHPSLP